MIFFRTVNPTIMQHRKCQPDVFQDMRGPSLDRSESPRPSSSHRTRLRPVILNGSSADIAVNITAGGHRGRGRQKQRSSIQAIVSSAKRLTE